MPQTNYNVGQIAGANFEATETAAQFLLGQNTTGNMDTEWVYCLASTAISAYDCCAVNASHVANSITSAMVTDEFTLVWPQVSVAAGSYFWGAKRGRGIKIRVATLCSGQVPLYTTATAGVLDDTAANAPIQGVRTITTYGSTTGLESGAPALLTFPICLTTV